MRIITASAVTMIARAPPEFLLEYVFLKFVTSKSGYAMMIPNIITMNPIGPETNNPCLPTLPLSLGNTHSIAIPNPTIAMFILATCFLKEVISAPNKRYVYIGLP